MLLLIALLVAVLLVPAKPASTASTDTTQLFTMQGSGASLANGDYLSSGSGLNTTGRFIVEVPPGLSRLVVEVSDAESFDATRGSARVR